MKDVIGRAIRLSAILQFVSGKMSLLFSTVTMVTVLSIKFHIYWPFAFLAVILFSFLAAFVVIKSGWYKREMKYIGNNFFEGKANK
jgi:ABC-type bacteriocin/lantibiotic exporter with double-glycine peptidase domain